MNERDLSVVILAAGLGTRMKSEQAKVLHKLGGIPLLAHLLHLALELEPERIVTVIGHQAQEVEYTIKRRFASDRLRFALQKEQRGTAHAVLAARAELEKGPPYVLILSGDVPLLQSKTVRQMKTLGQDRAATIVLLSFLVEDPTGYGRILRDAQGNVLQIREHKDCSEEERKIRECNASIYLVERDFLFEALDGVRTDNAQGEYYLTDIVETAVEQERGVQGHIVADPVEVMGVNDRAQLAQLESCWQQRRNEEWMRAGVTMHLPHTILVEYDVQLAEDCEIGPHCHLQGQSEVGRRCTLGAGCILDDAVLDEGVQLPPGTILLNKEK